MLLGVLADTHDELQRTERAVLELVNCGVEVIVHCGDITRRDVIEICSRVPLYYVFGNHDADNVPELQNAAQDLRGECLAWGGVIELADRRIAIAHGHLRSDIQPLIAEAPHYLLTGHFHENADWQEGAVRRVCPGALYRADTFTVATINLESDHVQFIPIT